MGHKWRKLVQERPISQQFIQSSVEIFHFFQKNDIFPCQLLKSIKKEIQEINILKLWLRGNLQRAPTWGLIIIISYFRGYSEGSKVTLLSGSRYFRG